jgi:integrase
MPSCSSRNSRWRQDQVHPDTAPSRERAGFEREKRRITGERPAVAVWTAAQTAQFLHRIAEHRLYAAYHLIALRGLRRGEAAGLRWCDLDLEGETAVICQQLQQAAWCPAPGGAAANRHPAAVVAP